MAKLVFLGTASAVPDERHENTHLAILGEERSILIDCTGSPIVRLRQAGIELDRLTDLILTHFHPDHISGVPSLLMVMWLLGRRRPINIYGLDHTLDRIEKLMDFFDWKLWPNFYPVKFVRLPEVELALVLENEEFRILSSPVHHLIPTIGLRVEFNGSSRALAYSCDTEPCQEVVRMAEGVDVLIHEASGASRGHSAPADAGRIARQAEVGALYLVHYTSGRDDHQSIVQEAAATFGGPVTLAEDFMELVF